MWEYKKIIATTISETEMNALGADGWENYAVTGNSWLFKRPKSYPLSSYVPTEGVQKGNIKMPSKVDKNKVQPPPSQKKKK